MEKKKKKCIGAVGVLATLALAVWERDVSSVPGNRRGVAEDG